MFEPEASSIETSNSRFKRHVSPFTPGIALGLGVSIYAMKQMVTTSGRKGKRNGV
jgi:hypothetical protein